MATVTICVPETSSAVVARAETGKAETGKAEAAKPGLAKSDSAKSDSAKSDFAKSDHAKSDHAKTEMPTQPANHGTGNGVLGVLPASSLSSSSPQAMAYADPAPRSAPQAVQQNGAIKPAAAVRSGWIIQVGALETENEAQQRIEAARSRSSGMLSKADPFTEAVVAKDNRKLYRARFAGLERDQAEAVCRTLKRADISCITVRN